METKLVDFNSDFIWNSNRQTDNRWSIPRSVRVIRIMQVLQIVHYGI